jgi:hypothetical protein
MDKPEKGLTPYQCRRLRNICDGCYQPIPPDSPYKCRCVPCRLRERKKQRIRFKVRPHSECGLGRKPLTRLMCNY